MPPTHQWLLPAALVGGAGIILSRNPWRRFPALFAWALLTALFIGMTFGGPNNGKPYPQWIIFTAAALVPIQCREGLGCVKIHVPWRRLITGECAVALAAFVLAGPTWNLWRCYHLIFWAVVMLAAAIYRLRHRILLNRRDKAYFYGMTLWLLCKAPASSFFRGGPGPKLFPSIPKDTVEVYCYWTLAACMVGMALAMWIRLPGRKRAAKKPNDGKTVTGLIEMERAA